MEFTKGSYRVRLSSSADDIATALELRRLAFRHGTGNDADAFDRLCLHVLIETREGVPVCCLRLLPLRTGSDIARSYSAQFYGLGGLERYGGRMVEMGRFCIRPGERDPDILRAAWAAVTRYVDAERVELLFGCASFEGTEAETYMEAFTLLKERHLAPSRWLPNVKAPSVVRFAQRLRGKAVDPKRAAKALPPLLRSYLAMGGWVSDHAVVDRDLNTLHVFTALEISEIPSARARLLRAAAA